MNRGGAVLVLLLMAVCAVSAQDWRYDEESELHVNCALVASLKMEFGEEAILKFADDELYTVADLLDGTFAACAEMDGLRAAEASQSRVAAPENEREIIAVLQDHDIHVFEDADCNVMLKDRFESNLNLSLVGMRLANMSAELYLPGAMSPIDMPHLDQYIIRLSSFDLTVRNKWAVGDSFPLGVYMLDVHIDGETYRFQWRREDEDVNTVVLTCVGYSADFEYDGDGAWRLNDGDVVELADIGCTVNVSDRFEENLNLSLAGYRREETRVDIYLPGESEKIEMPNTSHEVVNVYGIETPIRNEWVEGGSFPLGLYRFDAHIGDSTYRFEWQREDDAVNTITVNCLELRAEGDFDVELSAVLTDGAFYDLGAGNCHVGTIDLEAEFFSTIVSGSDRDKMSLEVTYPRMSTPVQMQQVETFVSDEGAPIRIEWVDAPSFPTGAYLISVTLNERTVHFRWDRQDDAFRTIVLTCLPAASESTSAINKLAATDIPPYGG